MGLRRATAVSFVAHAAILAALATGTGLYFSRGAAGPGEAVSVWIEAPEGADGPRSTPRSSAPDKGAKGRAAVQRSHERPKPGQAAETAGAGGGRNAEGSGLPGGAGSGGSEMLSRIWRRINASKYYPTAARRRGLAGMPRVTFAIGRDGSVTWVKLARSSGAAILDDAAMTTVKRAAPLPYYPGPITLAVKYSLGD